MNNRRLPSSNTAFVFRKAFVALFKQQRPTKPNDGTTQQSTGNAGKRERNPRQDKGMFAINVLVMLFTLVIAGAAVYQGWEIKREFKTLNEPYLEITQPRLVFTDSVSEMTVYYQLENLKAVPAQIIYKAQQCDLDTSNNPNTDSLFNLAEKEKDTAYLGNGKNAYLTSDSKWPPFYVRFNPKTSKLTKDGYELLKSTHIFWIYICDVIRYRDALTNTERVYKGIVRVKNIVVNNRFYAEYLYNENKEAN